MPGRRVLIARKRRITSLDSQIIDFGVLMARRLRKRTAIGRLDPFPVGVTVQNQTDGDGEEIQ